MSVLLSPTKSVLCNKNQEVIKPLRQWLRISIFNLLILSVVGIILRYKIAFSLPWIDQKLLLHGHSHFAFVGWITMALMSLLLMYLSKYGIQDIYKKYKPILIMNLIAAYGMLFSYPLEGNGIFSLSFSILSILTSYLFALLFWKDLNRIPTKSNAHLWFKAALIFNVISSVGEFGLLWMIVNRVIHQNWYLSTVYFYLHFQYNGWFFFACMGLLVDLFSFLQTVTSKLKMIFWLFCSACVPAYFLSALWMPIPTWVFVLVVLSAIAQVIAWVLFIRTVFENLKLIRTKISKIGLNILLLSSVALTIKLLLQLGSTYPPLSQLAFGFRPIVVGYLHLVLLGVITLFIFGYMISENFIQVNNSCKSGIIIFILGVFLNELLLMLQGAAGLDYHVVPYSNEMLLAAALIMFTGICLVNRSQFKNEIKDSY